MSLDRTRQATAVGINLWLVAGCNRPSSREPTERGEFTRDRARNLNGKLPVPTPGIRGRFAEASQRNSLARL